MNGRSLIVNFLFAQEFREKGRDKILEPGGSTFGKIEYSMYLLEFT